MFFPIFWASWVVVAADRFGFLKGAALGKPYKLAVNLALSWRFSQPSIFPLISSTPPSGEVFKVSFSFNEFPVSGLVGWLWQLPTLVFWGAPGILTLTIISGLGKSHTMAPFHGNRACHTPTPPKPFWWNANFSCPERVGRANHASYLRKYFSGGTWFWNNLFEINSIF